MHEQLKEILTVSEVIWIYDEPHGISVLQKTLESGRVLYGVMVYDSCQWHCIDIQETDEHGAQIMYNCMVKAVNAARSV